MTQTFHIPLLIFGVNISKYTSLTTSLSTFNFCPSELVEYAVRLGIDVNTEPHLLYIAREGLLAELPEGWRPW